MESMQAEQEDAEVRRIAPIDNDPEVMLTRFRGHCLARKQGSFEFSGYYSGRVPHSVRNYYYYLCYITPPLPVPNPDEKGVGDTRTAT